MKPIAARHRPMALLTVITAATLLLANAPAQAQSQGADGRVWMTPSNSANYEALNRQMREIVRLSARSSIEQAVNESTQGNYRVTSRDRVGAGSLHSPAHDRGAIDYTTPFTGTAQEHEQAREVSRRIGTGYTAVVERPLYGVSSMRITHPADHHTAYSNGMQGTERLAPGRATGNHTHVQPNFEVRMRDGGRTCAGCGVH